MKTILRNAVLAAGAVAAIATSTPASASATTAAVFTGTASIGCFGCGTYGPAGNSATLTVTGIIDGDSASGGANNATATFTVNEPASVACIVTGSATGTVTVQTTVGPKSAVFVWTRVGNVASITISAWHASGTAGFKVTSSLGNPCGGAVTAEVAGEVHG